MKRRWRRLLCRVLGHRRLAGVTVTRTQVKVGDGCSRCHTGTVKVRRMAGPLPHPDYRRRVTA